MLLPGRDLPFSSFARDLYREIDEDHLVDYAGSVTFSAFLAVFPFLLFVVALAGLVIDPATLDSLVAQIRALAPAQVADILEERLQALTTGASPGLLTLSGVGAVWSAASAVAALTTALNEAYDVREGRPFWKTRGLAILVTLGAAVLVIVASAIAIATPVVAGRLPSFLGAVVLWLRWPVAAAIMTLVVACLYYFLPDVEQRFRFITPGSVVAVVGWILASLGFSLYVEHFSSYEVVYGALGSVIVLMLWMWISALVILVGAEINAVIEHRSPEGKRTGAKSAEDTGADAPATAER
jgi:membrane protein